ncbi:MAG: DUF349 domain-containing protein [Kineosporiaceae bacterium]
MTGQQWGRVDADGTVWVRTGDAERAVGQYPGATPEEALAYFSRKYDDLVAQVDLLEQRLKAGQVSAGDAAATVRKLSAAIPEANAVGDLAGLTARVSGLSDLAGRKREEAEAARQQARVQAVAARTALVEEAETIAATDAERISWKTAGDRLRELFDQWRTLQRESRLDKPTEDELWKRFSHARTSFDRRRRQYFGALDEQRGQARAVKEAIVKEAEALQGSTDWGPTTSAYRALMDRWRAAGRAARRDDDALWERFRTAQDAFFSAKSAAAAASDAELRGNLEVKEALLVEAEALLPIEDLAAAKNALRDLQERWEAAGRVPRADLGRVEARLRRVEQAVREAEEERGARTNPEARARAQAVVEQLENAIAGLERDLEKARTAGKEKAVRDLEVSLQARQEWLAEARKALTDFSG